MVSLQGKIPAAISRKSTTSRWGLGKAQISGIAENRIKADIPKNLPKITWKVETKAPKKVIGEK